jgi:hypothetical protein
VHFKSVLCYYRNSWFCLLGSEHTGARAVSEPSHSRKNGLGRLIGHISNYRFAARNPSARAESGRARLTTVAARTRGDWTCDSGDNGARRAAWGSERGGPRGKRSEAGSGGVGARRAAGGEGKLPKLGDFRQRSLWSLLYCVWTKREEQLPKLGDFRQRDYSPDVLSCPSHADSVSTVQHSSASILTLR